MEDFEYKRIKFRHVEKHNDHCDGCYFYENNISCIPKDVPECNTGIFVKVEEDEAS